MSAQDQARWDERHAAAAAARPLEVALPAVFAPFAAEFPTHGQALELACGQGLTSVWLALRGMTVTGLDISAVAVERARELAAACGVDQRCTFATTDLDDGIPPGPRANVIVCHKFRDPRLDQLVIGRLARRGLLAISALSEVGARPGAFRARAGELPRAFAALELVAADEADGLAWLLARR
jgi:hypothetical protein